MGSVSTSKKIYLSLSRFTMSSSVLTNITGFNKSKEDFIWFIKRAVKDKKSDSYAELYHCLIKMFVDADTNKDGLVSRGSFSKLVTWLPLSQGSMDMLLMMQCCTRPRRRRSKPGRK